MGRIYNGITLKGEIRMRMKTLIGAAIILSTVGVNTAIKDLLVRYKGIKGLVLLLLNLCMISVLAGTAAARSVVATGA